MIPSFMTDDNLVSFMTSPPYEFFKVIDRSPSVISPYQLCIYYTIFSKVAELIALVRQFKLIYEIRNTDMY